MTLNTGRFHLPIYTGATRPDLTFQGANELDKAPGVSLCVRVGYPGQKLIKAAGGPETNIVDYVIPPYHQDLYQPGQPIKAPSPSGSPGKPAEAYVSPAQLPPKQPQPASDLKNPSAAPITAYKPDIPIGMDPSEMMQIDSRYKCRGLRIRFHYALTNRNYEKFSLKCTLKNSQGGVLVDNNF